VIRKLHQLGDPIELTGRGYELTLRKSEAELIWVLRDENERISL
ncbi:ferrous iron transport protein A, partial [Enterococcus lactis]